MNELKTRRRKKKYNQGIVGSAEEVTVNGVGVLIFRFSLL